MPALAGFQMKKELCVGLNKEHKVTKNVNKLKRARRRRIMQRARRKLREGQAIKKRIKMDNLSEQLKINICSILNSLSEETINGIIDAVKHVGLESAQDLKFVQEEDLISALKPIHRRKLVKVWSEQIQAKSIDEFLKTNICSILHTVSKETVCGIIDALKYAGLESLSDLQFIKEEDLLLVLKPIQRRKLLKAWSKPESKPKEEEKPVKEEQENGTEKEEGIPKSENRPSEESANGKVKRKIKEPAAEVCLKKAKCIRRKKSKKVVL